MVSFLILDFQLNLLLHIMCPLISYRNRQAPWCQIMFINKHLTVMFQNISKQNFSLSRNSYKSLKFFLTLIMYRILCFLGVAKGSFFIFSVSTFSSSTHSESIPRYCSVSILWSLYTPKLKSSQSFLLK